jgi:mannitol-specific phosphotransferase system IIBC component
MGTIAGSDVHRVVVACDAGMGSSVLETTQLAKRFKKLGVEVVHSSVHHLPPDTPLVVCHEGLAKSARIAAPDATIVTFKMFLGDPAFDRLERAIKSGAEING